MTGRHADAVIVGGGPAGAAAASWLAQAGRRVVLFERSRGAHHKVCGEFLSGEAEGHARALGVAPEGLGAPRIERVRIARGRLDAAAPLPFPAWSLSRARLDEALLQAARANGAEIRRGVSIRRLETEPSGMVLAHPARGPALAAGTGWLATGKHALPGWPRPAPGSGDPIGFKLYLALGKPQQRALEGHVEIFLFEGGYAGLQPVAGGLANLCLLVERETYGRLGRSWPALLARIGQDVPLFAERLAGAQPCWAKPLAVAGLPYGFVQRGAEPGAVHRLGDQLAVIPSFCGDGMAIALDSARRSVQDHLAGRPPGDGSLYRGQVATAMLAAKALRRPMLALPAIGLARLVPGLLGLVARRTRVPPVGTDCRQGPLDAGPAGTRSRGPGA